MNLTSEKITGVLLALEKARLENRTKLQIAQVELGVEEIEPMTFEKPEKPEKKASRKTITIQAPSGAQYVGVIDEVEVENEESDTFEMKEQ